jgi:tetratricopeptide (TPR) repeat protein
LARWAPRDAGTHLEQALTATKHLPQTREAIEQEIDVRFDLRNAIHPLGEVERGIGLIREAGSLAEQLGDEARMGKISLALSVSLWMMGHSDEAQDPIDRALAIAESTDDALLRNQARGHLARLHHDRGDYGQAVVVLQESLAQFQKLGDKEHRALSLIALGSIAFKLGDYERMLALGKESLRLCWEIGNQEGIAMCLEGLAAVAVNGKWGYIDKNGKYIWKPTK